MWRNPHPVAWYPIKNGDLNAISCVRVKEKKTYLTLSVYFFEKIFVRKNGSKTSDLYISCEYLSKRLSSSLVETELINFLFFCSKGIRHEVMDSKDTNEIISGCVESIGTTIESVENASKV